MSEVLNRNIKLLQLIPKYPRKKSPKQLQVELLNAGFTISERSVQRDLNALADLDDNGFPIVCDNRSPPFGWSWVKDAISYDLPSMDKNTALSFYLNELFLEKLTPPSVKKYLAPHFNRAKAVLDDKNKNGLSIWRDKVKVLPRTQPLQAPALDNDTLEIVYQALLEGKQFSVKYKPRLKELSKYLLNPLGLVVIDQLIYLVATNGASDKPLQFLLNRMKKVQLLDNDINDCTFDLEEYINEGHFEYLKSTHIIDLHLKISNYSSVSFKEAPLSKDQTLKQLEDGQYLVTATVKDTNQLRWWLMGFGDGIEVLKPESLRKEIIEMAQKILAKYKV